MVIIYIFRLGVKKKTMKNLSQDSIVSDKIRIILLHTVLNDRQDMVITDGTILGCIAILIFAVLPDTCQDN
jgi:hypothetical protein